MAGSRAGEFTESVSPFLRAKIGEALELHGAKSPEYLALHRQYIKSPLENQAHSSERQRHFHSELKIEFEGRPLIGVERLYRQTILVEPTTVCAAHCRWCIRALYPIKSMTSEEIDHVAAYIGSSAVREDLTEVVISGGDPLVAAPRLRQTLEAILRRAPNIKIVRIHTRVPFHHPELVSDALLRTLSEFPQFVFEVGVHVNHPVEFWPEAIDALRRLRSVGARLYNQHPLLRGVNDDPDTLKRLYTLLREHLIEAHYILHAAPMRGMAHHRTSLEKAASLLQAVSSSGAFSGRAKPRLAALTDIGKVALYEGSILKRDSRNNTVLIRSGFKLQDRLKWSPGWQVPESAVVEKDGTLLVWYPDGTDEP